MNQENYMDLIWRRDALRSLGDAPKEDSNFGIGRNVQWQEDVYAIKGVPAANKEGKWLFDSNAYGDILFLCSCCKTKLKVPTSMLKPLWKYCPICGNPKATE